MKKYLLCIVVLLTATTAFSQNYLDIVRLNMSRTSMEDLDKTYETDITNVNLEILYPTPISDNTILITGLTAETTELNFNALADPERITMTRLNLGAKVYHSRKWTGTYMLLPKLASDFENLTDRDFQFGVLGLLEYRIKNRIRAKFGVYTSTENFGRIVTPLLGVYYRSPNNKFYIDAALPIRMEANYTLTDKFSVGADLRTSIKSYHLSGRDFGTYTQEESIRFGFYGSYGMMDNTLLLRLKAGLDTTDYGTYRFGDEVGTQVLTFALDGDNRTRLNNEFDSSIFLGLDVIYRLDL